MRKKGSGRSFRGWFFMVAMMLICDAHAQDAVSLNRKKTPRKSLHAGVSTPAKDTTIARQPLLSILKQLNQSKGIYFLFSDKSFGERLVKPIGNINRPVDQILEELLQSTGLGYKKVNDKTFVIIAVPIIVLPDKIVTAKTAPKHSTTEKKTQLVKGRVTNMEGKPLVNVSIGIMGSNRGTATNAEGEFEIEGYKGEVLELTSVGYEKKEIHLNNSGAIIYLNAQLSVIENMMN